MRFPFVRPKAALVPFGRSDAAMGTTVYQEVYGINAEQAAQDVFKEIQRLEGLWSLFLDTSEISLLNNSAGVRPVPVSPETARILSFAKSLWFLSSGAFDVSTGPLIQMWRESLEKGSLPDTGAIGAATGLKGCGEIRLLPDCQAYLPRKGQAVDLGAIGKGFAADRAGEIYRHAGIRSACISLGGNVLVVGRRPGGDCWTIGIRDPAGGRNECVGYLEAENCSVVTSGGYERFAECGGARYHHIIDPATGRPSAFDSASVTVIASSSMAADALSTAAFVLGIKKGVRLIESFKGVQAVFVDGGGKAQVTAGSARLIKI
jgi:thiamine biosynthesis lipoprotein